MSQLDKLPARTRISIAKAGIHSASDLYEFVCQKGFYWWKEIPSIGLSKANVVLEFLISHEEELGALPAEVTTKPSSNIRSSQTIVLGRNGRSLMIAPLGGFVVPEDLDGHDGANRHSDTPLISAKTDLEAIFSYLHKFRDQPAPTLRAYTKEIERFYLWCLIERGVAMSSLVSDDAEAYKDFLLAPPSEWCERKKANKSSRNWRPFAGPLSAKSATYALGVLKSFFQHLCSVKYLAGNPWVAVSMPKTLKREKSIHIEKAIPAALWEKLTGPEGILDELCATDPAILAHRYKLRGAAAFTDMAAQYRMARVITALGGVAGMRRQEIAAATRGQLQETSDDGVWALRVIGKGFKERTVYLSDREVFIIQAHWRDRGLDFDLAPDTTPLLAPLVILQTESSVKKHFDSNGNLIQKGFSDDSIYQFLINTFKRISEDNSININRTEKKTLMAVGVHALRHTFGTMAAKKVPLEILRDVLGHTSIQTTSIYVNPEEDHKRKAMTKFFSKNA